MRPALCGALQQMSQDRVATTVESDRNARGRGGTEQRNHQVRTVYTGGSWNPQAAQEPDQRHAVGRDQIGALHDSAKSRRSPGFHDVVDRAETNVAGLAL